MDKSPTSRPYRKVARARREEETRRRITEAAVQLHGTLGPASTTIADVARRAGVSRMTVYNHFPTEADLFVACSSHWASAHPFPDPSRWTRVEDVAKRLPAALRELYGWYGVNSEMLGKVFRDAPAVPALAEVMDNLWAPHARRMVDALAHGWTVERGDSRRLRAALRLLVAFETWSGLIRSGLDDQASADLATRMALAAFEPRGPG